MLDSRLSVFLEHAPFSGTTERAMEWSVLSNHCNLAPSGNWYHKESQECQFADKSDLTRSWSLSWALPRMRFRSYLLRI